jgi:hypothetical protein
MAADAGALVRIEVRRLDGLMPLTILYGVYVIHLLTVSTSSFSGSIRSCLRCGSPPDPGDRDVVDEPGYERHHDCPSESVILQDCGHDAASAAGCGYPPWAAAVG